MILEEIVEKLSFLHRELVEKDRRIGWLENELALMRNQMAGLTGNERTSEPEEATIGDDPNAWITGPRIRSVACENDTGGQWEIPAPMDHQHQGVFSINIEGCDVVSSEANVGEVSFAGETLDAITYIVHPTAPGEATADRKGQQPSDDIGANINWDETYCNAGFIIGHRPNVFADTAHGGPGVCSPNMSLAGCTPMAGVLALDDEGADDCTSFFIMNKIKIDCAGHIVDAHRLEVLTPVVATTIGDVIPYNVSTNVFTPNLDEEPVYWDCISGGAGPATIGWRLNLIERTLCIPNDSWSPTTPPTGGVGGAPSGGCSGYDVMVVTGITVAALEGYSCGKSITITYGCVTPGSTPSVTSLDVVTNVCYDSYTCQIKVRKRNITVFDPAGAEGTAVAIDKCP